MDNSASEPKQLSAASIRRLLSVVREALRVAIPARGRRRLTCLMLLEHRGRIARASIGMLVCNTCSDQLDYESEADHIPHQLVRLPRRPISGQKDGLAVPRHAPASMPARPRDAR